MSAFLLSGCGGSPSTQCPPPQTLAIDGYSTGSTPELFGGPTTSGPFSPASTFLYFSYSGGPPQASDIPVTEVGVPILHGSDGSTITAGALTPNSYTHLNLTRLYGYTSTISGLSSNVTYAVSFASLRGVPNGCAYGGQRAGSFTTN